MPSAAVYINWLADGNRISFVTPGKITRIDLWIKPCHRRWPVLRRVLTTDCKSLNPGWKEVKSWESTDRIIREWIRGDEQVNLIIYRNQGRFGKLD